MTRRRRIGVLGGSFDPPHIGHLVLAQECWWQLELDELRLVPAARSPLKDAAPRFSGDLRARMVARAVEGHAALTLSRVELEREAPSYTVDTLRSFADAEPEAELWLVLGGDQLLDLHRWRDPEGIVALARLAVATRPGDDPAALQAAAGKVAPSRVDWVEMPQIAVSSSMVRERLDAGRPVRYLLPAGVEKVIRSAG
jgi:nicotinate-nucleotide adenylyltransferase